MFLRMLPKLMGSLGRLSGASLGKKIILIHIWRTAGELKKY